MFGKWTVAVVALSRGRHVVCGAEKTDFKPQRCRRLFSLAMDRGTLLLQHGSMS